MSIQGAFNTVIGNTERAIGIYKYFQNAEYDSLLHAANTAETNAAKQSGLAEALGDAEKKDADEAGKKVKEGENKLAEMVDEQGKTQEKLMSTIANKGAPRGANGRFVNRQTTIDDLTAKRDSLQGNIEFMNGALELGRAKQEMHNEKSNAFMHWAAAANDARIALQVNREGLEAARSGSIFARAKAINESAPAIGRFNDDIHKADTKLAKEYYKRKGV